MGMHGKKEGGERPLLFYGLLTSQGFGAHPTKEFERIHKNSSQPKEVVLGNASS